MLRCLASLCLALLCVAPCRAGSVPSLLAFASIPSQRDPSAQTVLLQNEQKIAQYQQQALLADQGMQSAEQQLEANLAGLRRFQALHGNSPELTAAIAQVEGLAAKVQALRQGEKSQSELAAVGERSVPAIASEVDRLTALSQQAQTYAAQGGELAEMTVASLSARKNDGISPKAAISHHAKPDRAPDRSPASVPPSNLPAPLPPPAEHAAPIARPIPPAENDPETIWFNKLKNGLLQYSVPATMQWKVPSTVTVQIQGENAPSTGPIQNQTGQAALKISRHMKVEVSSAPDNPDEFIVAPEPGTELEQFVPEDGPTTWNFSVTPRYTGTGRQIVIRAWVIYDNDTQREFPAFQKAVNVHIPSFGECLKRLLEGDPDYWLKYGLPGGAGFVFVSGLVAGLWKWLAKRKERRVGHRVAEP